MLAVGHPESTSGMRVVLKALIKVAANESTEITLYPRPVQPIGPSAVLRDLGYRVLEGENGIYRCLWDWRWSWH